MVKCVPVECKIWYTEGCFNELPVTHRNVSYFLLPRSRILVRIETPKECNGFLPSIYQLRGTWFRMTPKFTESLPPPVIQPLMHLTWKYVSPIDLATSEIYSTDDLDRLRTHNVPDREVVDVQYHGTRSYRRNYSSWKHIHNRTSRGGIIRENCRISRSRSLARIYDFRFRQCKSLDESSSLSFTKLIVDTIVTSTGIFLPPDNFNFSFLSFRLI